MNSSDMIKQYLTTHGFDGLANDKCGCGLDDFAPCGDGPFHDCVSANAFVVPADGVVTVRGETISHELDPGDVLYYQTDDTSE